jgi:hypothetical protein
MIAHLVLLTPHDDLSVEDREAMASAMEQAFTNIPQIARVKVGRRRLLGYSYDALSPVHFEFIAVLEFHTVEDLDTYLKHPAHVELGKRFRSSAKIALANDFEIVDATELRTLVDPDSLR